jgi:L-fucose mutarotase
MGHGDEIAIVDANFPAASTASSTVTGQPILMAGVSAVRAVEPVLSVMPLDNFVPDPALRMEVTGDPVAVPAVQQEVQQAIDRAVGRHQPPVGIERFAFYERAAEAFAIVATGERATTAASSSRRACCRRSDVRHSRRTEGPTGNPEQPTAGGRHAGFPVGPFRDRRE